MKIHKYLIIGSLAMAFAVACNKGIDPITSVAPGPDTAAPAVKINYPIEGAQIRDDAPTVVVNFQVDAKDDIELASIVLNLDGTNIATFTSFKDYRHGIVSYVQDGIGNGDHLFTVIATDLAGKPTTKAVHFKKTTPYHPLYDGEVFYMPFDGDYVEAVSNTPAVIVGTPGFGTAKIGLASYKGFADSYLTFPSTVLQGATEFSVAFWYNMDSTLIQRAGLIAISKPMADPTVNPDGDIRFTGFRLGREPSGKNQGYFINFGTTTQENWSNPFTVLKWSTKWYHIAISISGTKFTVYVNNVVKATGTIPSPIDFTGCPTISIGSGQPNWIYWTHLAEPGMIDELRFFTKAITADEVNSLYTAGK